MLVCVRLVDDATSRRRAMLVEVSGRRESPSDAMTRAQNIALEAAGSGWWLDLVTPCDGKNAVVFDSMGRWADRTDR